MIRIILYNDLSKWDKRFISLCKNISEWSEDTTQVGAIIVGPHKEIKSTGYNGLPREFLATEERLQRPEKYNWMVHAEENAILNAARIGVSVRDCILYVNLFPCHKCMASIIQTGIKKVVCFAPDYLYRDNSQWLDSWERSCILLRESIISSTIIINNQETKELYGQNDWWIKNIKNYTITNINECM